MPEGLALGGAALLGAVIVLAVLLVVRQQLRSGPGEGEQASTTVATSDTTASVAPEPPTPEGGDGQGAPPGGDVEPIACPAGVEVVVCEAASFVQRTRQRPFRTFPNVEVMGDEDFDRALLVEVEESSDELRRDEIVLKALGLLDADISLVESYRGAIEVGVIGFYDPADDRLAVRGDDLGLHAQLILVHELTHALDDQWFDLDRDDLGDGDAEYAFTAVVEGNARRVEELWRDGLDADQAARLQQEELGTLSVDELEQYLAIPPVLRALLTSPYLDGQTYVDTVVAGGGQEAVDAALTSPPASSEEILHPDLDRSADPEGAVERPPAGGGAEVRDDGRLGELLVRLWLGELAADGWGGDRYVAYLDESGRSCVTVDLVADSGEDLVEMETTAEGWVLEQPGDRSIEPVTASGEDAVRISGCA